MTYHKNCQKVVDYLVQGGVGNTIYLSTLRCLEKLRNFLSQNNTVYSGREANRWFRDTGPYPRGYQSADFRMANEYPLMLRFYYCCGMRNNEVCVLEPADVDLESCILAVRDGKNHKNRLVYLPENFRHLAKEYAGYIKRMLGYELFGFSPRRVPDKHVSKSQVDKKFSVFWSATDSSKQCDKKLLPLFKAYVCSRQD